VAKTVLIAGVQVVMQQARMKFAKLPETELLIKEMQNYRVRVTEAANETFAAREGENDDIVLALALAVWAGERLPLLTAAGGAFAFPIGGPGSAKPAWRRILPMEG
jgi:hypothetical protein